jgi:phosphoheptose isomerase family protein
MKETTLKIYNELFERYPSLNIEKESILRTYLILEECYKTKNKILICGNGGSASDSEHIVGELMKQFKKKRKMNENVYNKLGEYGEEGKKLQNTLEGSLRSIALTSHIALSTAFSNDKEPTVVFAQQLYGLADSGDVLISLSTSGNSENCVLASILAKTMGVKTVAITGKNESRLSKVCDVTIKVPESETYKVQELHLPVYHALCAMLEEEIF